MKMWATKSTAMKLAVFLFGIVATAGCSPATSTRNWADDKPLRDADVLRLSNEILTQDSSLPWSLYYANESHPMTNVSTVVKYLPEYRGYWISGVKDAGNPAFTDRPLLVPRRGEARLLRDDIDVAAFVSSRGIQVEGVEAARDLFRLFAELQHYSFVAPNLLEEHPSWKSEEYEDALGWVFSCVLVTDASFGQYEHFCVAVDHSGALTIKEKTYLAQEEESGVL